MNMAIAMPIIPGNLPLTIRRGSSFGPMSIFCQDGLGAALNLTGYSVAALARPEILSPNTYDFGPAVAAPATGEIVIELTDEETQRDWPAGKYTWDLVLQTGAGDRLPPTLAGKLTVIDENTRV